MRSIPGVISGVVAVLVLSASGVHGEDGGPLKQIPLVELAVRPLVGSPSTEPEELVLKADRPGRLEFDVEWEGVGRVGVDFSARAEPSDESGAQLLFLRAVLTLPDGHKIQASRQSVVDHRSTLLFELFRRDDRPFTLAIEATVSETWEIVRVPSVGAPVRFEVEIVRVNGSDRVSLERNMLHTFENQSVRYEFSMGPELDDEALALSLTPLRLVEDLIQIRVNVAGRLPHGDDVTVIARNEILVANRGNSSAVTVVVGNPPVGYVFQVTAYF